MPCCMAPRHRAAAVRVCTVSHLHEVPTTVWTDLYERSRLHPPFTALVWRFPHRCVLDCPSIEPGLAAVASSHPPIPLPACLPSLLHPNGERTFRMGGRYPWGRSYVLLHRRSFSSIHRYHTKNRHATIPGCSRNGYECTGLPVRDCAESCKSSVPRCAKVSIVDVMNKTIFEHLYLVQGLGTLYLRVKYPYVLTPPPLTDQRFLDFRAIFFNFTEIQK